MRLGLLAFLLFMPASAGAQDTLALTFEYTLERAAWASEDVAMAAADVYSAGGEVDRARSAWLPELSLSASYDRLLATEAGWQDEQAAGAQGALPSGGHQWQATGVLKQTLFAGGGNRAASRVADLRLVAAERTLDMLRAEAVLVAARAFFDAALAERRVRIARASLDLAEETLMQAEAGVRSGSKPGYEALRARVARDNQRVVVLEREAERDLAMIRLGQIVDGAPEQAIRVVGDLEQPRPDVAEIARRVAGVPLAPRERAEVRQAETLVRVREAELDRVRAQHWPRLAIESRAGAVQHAERFAPGVDAAQLDWAVGVVLEVPLLAGGRVLAERQIAVGESARARAQLERTRERDRAQRAAVRLEAETARERVRATNGTVRLAVEAYDIARVRFREGVSTQVELADARLLLEEARGHRASAVRDLQLLEVRSALLVSLPFDADVGLVRPKDPAAST